MKEKWVRGGSGLDQSDNFRMAASPIGERYNNDASAEKVFA
jgi:hypothetical protein